MNFRLTLLACFISFLSFSQIKSPDQFLGYELGTRFTYHHQLVAYCKYIAEQKPSMATWQSYGKTNEGRELGILLLSKPGLSNKLELIKEQHRQIIIGQKAISNDLPLIINLSFNVHGNEAAGSEAALGAIYDLVKEDGLLSKATSNYVVLMDPCINPDGRDAYVTQFNRRNFTPGGNADPNDQEHFEGSTSGRYNHYSFDLNRDWVWQTQVETQQRIAFFQSWMPMVHADFHEQSYQHTYYFPPAAKPYLNFISSSTKDLQTSVGNSFAKLFDQNHWPYFTSEVYDLFYPGYGDTYPILNGALGMTLEQGGIRGGLQAQKSNKDTIRFVDRVNHHRQLAVNLVDWAISNSSMVKSSYYQNHQNARTNPSNLYKTYIIPQSEVAKSSELLKILKSNRILVSQLDKDYPLNAFSFLEQKNIPLKATKGDLIVSAYQSAAPMIQALLDPTPALEDSVTYDITAWNLFQIHGVKGYGVKERLIGVDISLLESKDNVFDEKQVSYVFKPDSKAVNFVNQVLKAGYLVVYNDKEVGFTGKKYEAGHLWVIKKKGSWDALRNLANQAKVQVEGINTYRSESGADLGSTHFIEINPTRVAVVVDGSFDVNQQGELAYYLTQKMQLKPSFIPLNQVKRANLNEYSHLIFPNTRYLEFSKTETVLIEDYVRKGGRVLLMENAASSIKDKELAILAKDLSDSTEAVVAYEDAERNEISKTLTGNLIEVNLEKTHPLGFRIQRDQVIVLNQVENLIVPNIRWKSILTTEKSSKYYGFMGAKVKGKLDHSMFLATYTLGAGNYIWFGFNPLFRAIPNQTMTLFENALLYHAE
ncbi:M14 family zinc carboxypeptidase [Aquirufa sp. 5-AUSEE-100C1]